ncbi:MAG: transposase family protein [Planctomycetaceae bacterium]|nr:transposase family protein [Planctomycetaceae bacterium]
MPFLHDVPDPRERQGQRHDFVAMRATVVCAMLCGHGGLSGIAQWIHAFDATRGHPLEYRRRPLPQGTRGSTPPHQSGHREKLSNPAVKVTRRAPFGREVHRLKSIPARPNGGLLHRRSKSKLHRTSTRFPFDFGLRHPLGSRETTYSSDLTLTEGPP